MKLSEKKHARGLYAQGVPRPSIAVELGVARSTVINWTRDMALPKKPCPCCNEQFQPKRTNQGYCSTKCRKQYEYQFRTPPIEAERECKGCDKGFKPRHRGHLYCTFKCRDKYISKQHYQKQKAIKNKEVSDVTTTDNASRD